MWRAALAGLVLCLGLPRAGAYEFEVRARTLGQASAVRSYRFTGDDVILSRRRFTQILSLELWDLGRGEPAWRAHDATPPHGPRLSFSSYLRIDHDFGGYLGGTLDRGARRLDAMDLIPELEADSLQLDVLYAYFAAEGLLDGALDLYAGRTLDVDGLDFASLDGVTARLRTPVHLALEASAGFRVRADSLLGDERIELDGTSGGQCQEYVEGATPGAGSWQPIDRGLLVNASRFRNDFDLCPQRQELMPSVGGAIESRGLPVHLRLAYRRVESPTPGLIGAADRFTYRDVGYYPNELGQAPTWGVNQEQLTATARATVRGLGGRASPYAAVRYSLLHGLIDRAYLGARLSRGRHGLTPEIARVFPTFDGDSIFNVFSAEPYVDLHLTYDLDLGPVMTYARVYGRQFRTEDRSQAAPGVTIDPTVWAEGGQLGGAWQLRPGARVRLDLFADRGYGGRRTGGVVAGRWPLRDDLDLDGRLSYIDFREDLLADLAGRSVSGQLGATYQVNDGVALRGLVEETSNRLSRNQLGLFAVLDLAFRPEL